MDPKVQPHSLELPAADPALWPLDPGMHFLNHGSFGSCPKDILQHQQGLRDRLERQPIQFLARDLEPLLDQVRAELAAFLGAKADHLVFVPNATSGVNTVLRSLPFRPGDEWLVTNHEYQACRNALEFAAARAGTKVVVADIPFPIADPEEAVQAILACVNSRTRLALIDHVTSQTALVLPLATIVRRLREAGVETLVDGAHAPGMVPLNLEEVGAAYYTGNCHKWLCAPKSAGFLYVAPERQALIRPLTISHGATSPRTDRSKFQIEFAWPGTWDPTACLSVSASIRWMDRILPGGWPQVMSRNRALALQARALLAEGLGIPAPCPDTMIGAMASLPLPKGKDTQPPQSPLYCDPDQDRLREEFSIEVPIIPWPSPPNRLLRVSAQLYNSLPQYRRLAETIPMTSLRPKGH